MNTAEKKLGAVLLVLTFGIATTSCSQNHPDEAMATFQGNAGRIFCAAFSPDGKWLALGTGGFDARIWNATTGQELTILKHHASGISSIAFSPTGDTLAVGSWDKTISLWSLPDVKRIETIPCDGQVSKIAYGIGSDLLAAVETRGVSVWDLKDTPSKKQAFLETKALSLAFNPNGQTLIVAGKDNSIKEWNLKTGETQPTFQGESSGALAFSMSADGKVFALATDTAVTLIDYNAGRTKLRTTIQTILNCVALSPDGRILAGGGADKSVKFLETSTGKEIAIMTGHRERINSVAFSHSGSTLASSSDDGSVKLWAAPKL